MFYLGQVEYPFTCLDDKFLNRVWLTCKWILLHERLLNEKTYWQRILLYREGTRLQSRMNHLNMMKL